MADKNINPKAQSFIDTDAMADMHPEANQFIDADQADKVKEHLKVPEVAALESARAGLASGGTFGFAPRIGAAGGALASKAQQSLSKEPNPQSLQDLYNEYLKYNNERQEKAKAGNPATYHATEFVGALASPMNKIGAVGQLGNDASMLAKMAHSGLAGAKMGSVAGLSQSPDLANIPKDLEGMGTGAAMGAGLGLAVPPVGAVMKGAAKGTVNMIRPLIGKPAEMFKKGAQAGMEGAPNLAGEPGQLEAVQQRNQFADQFVQDLHKVLSGNAKNKRELIAGALEKSQLAPAEAVEAVTQKYLDANPQLNEESARKELDQLKEMILTAREGGKKTEVVRQYINPEMRMVPGNAPVAPPAEVPASAAAIPEMPPAAPKIPSPVQSATAETPTGFEGYESVHKATVSADDEAARELFKHRIHEKLADERALGKNYNDSPVQIEEHAIPGSDKVRLIAKRPIQVEPEDAFAEQAKALTQRQKEQKRLQDLLDKQSEEAYKLKQQQESEMLKPQFQDVEQTVREGGRNLQNPEELYALQKNLQAKSRFSEGRGFSSQEMNKMSGDAARDIAQLIKTTVPESVPVDERLNAFNNVAESLGIDTNKLQLPGGEGQLARQQAMQKILGILKPEAATDKSQINQGTIDYVQDQLRRVHPDIGSAFEKEAAKHAETAGTMNEIIKPDTVGGGGPILSSIRRGLNKTAYGAGHALGSEINKMEPAMAQANKIFQNYTPDALREAGAAASQSTNQAVQQMGQILSKLSTADDRTRNSMMFVLEQQAGYRQLMSPYFKKQEPGTPQAKDKSLEKYK